MEQRPSPPTCKRAAHIRSRTPEPRTAASRGNPHSLAAPPRGDRGRTAPPTQSHRARRSRAGGPGSALRCPQAPTGRERPPSGGPGWRPRRRTRTLRKETVALVTPPRPIRARAASGPIPSRDGEARAWGRGLESRPPLLRLRAGRTCWSVRPGSCAACAAFPRLVGARCGSCYVQAPGGGSGKRD